MALPPDFWRSEQMLNIFRSKQCQRLFRDGVCEWRSFCQYSHVPGWPRRNPKEHRYSPELCPHLQVSMGSDGLRVDHRCSNGVLCGYAHSKDEVLYHPLIFKTTCCEDWPQEQRDPRDVRAPRRGRRTGKCHRHYCPFSHGPQETRESKLPLETREAFVTRALEMFPSDSCCRVCTPVRLGPTPPPPSQISDSRASTVPSSFQAGYDARANTWQQGAFQPPTATCRMQAQEFMAAPREMSWWPSYAGNDVGAGGLAAMGVGCAGIGSVTWGASGQDSVASRGAGFAAAAASSAGCANLCPSAGVAPNADYGWRHMLDTRYNSTMLGSKLRVELELSATPAPLAVTSAASSSRPPPPSVPVPPPPMPPPPQPGGAALAAASSEGGGSASTYTHHAVGENGSSHFGANPSPPGPERALEPYPGSGTHLGAEAAASVWPSNPPPQIKALPLRQPPKEQTEWTHLLSESLVQELLMED